MTIDHYQAAQPHPIDAAVKFKMSGVKSNAWLFWLFLGGVWANAAYLHPKHRVLIIVLGIAGLFLTLGISGIIGILFGWLFNLDTSAMEAEIRAEEEQAYLRATQIAAIL